MADKDKNPAIIVAWLVFGALVILSIWLGISSYQTLKSSEGSAIAAVVAFIGVLITTVISLLGILVKSSYDQRSLKLEIEAEKRLKLESAIEAISLQSTPDGRPSSIGQQSSSLILLAELKQLELALVMLSHMWPEENITPAAAARLIDIGLQSENPINEAMSAEILLHNSTRLVNPSTCEIAWPEIITNKWTLKVKPSSRSLILSALIDLMMVIEPKKWDPGPFGFIISTLYYCYLSEDDPQIKLGAAGILLQVVVWKMENQDVRDLRYTIKDTEVSLQDISADIKGYLGGSLDDKINEVGIPEKVHRQFVEVIWWLYPESRENN